MTTDHDFELISKPAHPDNSGLKQYSTVVLEYLTADFIHPIPPKTTNYKAKLRIKQRIKEAALSSFFQRLKIQHTESLDANCHSNNEVSSTLTWNTNQQIFK
ncbi:hypothetical protein [Vibrio sp. 10N.286.46.E10]|uniref:hypothetical protein n=1 Tax=unclassified Vibrio TaxID=2614977 RepID=UPI000C830A35|nr:hypothetical protein [Vibrio sp. 10N.286.46.E10]PMI96308.1 hypothetical protein BCU34_18925 [Vibrio sp. 10N.286.45.E10]PTQ23626.1 hypothetical protein CWO24_12125 [Vibrio sp. 10N.286.46.E10]